ncbi:6-phosphogluconate phosphatase [Enterobacterales bacterium CwR94]|nr:6-phosphogluconate phosphatase [Enterobacterales bacterium CwR94]
MTVKCVFFDCDGTLVDSERLCTEGYVTTFAKWGIELSLQEMFEKYKGVKLYDIVADVLKQHGAVIPMTEFEPAYRAEVARLFDEQLQPIAGAQALIKSMCVPICTVSNGTVKKMQHSLGLTGMLEAFGDRLYSGYDIQRWKPDPDLMHHAADKMQVDITECILIDDSEAGAKAGIAAGIPVFYFCADSHNPPLHHPLVTTFTELAQLPALWAARGWTLVNHA